MQLSTEHKLSRQSGGEGYHYWIQAICTCGWKGKVHYAWEDYQHFLTQEEIREHYAQIRKENESQTSK